MNDLSKINKKELLDDFNKFIIDNNIIGTCAGVIIALVTKDLILSFVSDIIIPLFIFIFIKLHIKSLTNILPSGKLHFDITNFIKQFTTWFLTLIVTYIIISLSFKIFLGIKINNVNEKK